MQRDKYSAQFSELLNQLGPEVPVDQREMYDYQPPSESKKGPKPTC